MEIAATSRAFAARPFVFCFFFFLGGGGGVQGLGFRVGAEGGRGRGFVWGLNSLRNIRILILEIRCSS